MRRWCAVFLLCAVPAVAVDARAQSSADKAAAEALFDQGRKLMKKKNYAEACPKLQASQQLDSGIGTLLFLGECYEKLGKIASAWATFKQAESTAEAAGQAPRARIAKVRVAALEPQLTKLELQLGASDIPGLELRRDGELIPLASVSVAIPVDPGSIELTANAPGYVGWTKQVDVPKGPTVITVQVPALKAIPVEEPPPKVVEPPPAKKTSPVRDDGGQGQSGSTQRTIGLVVGGVGIAALAGGTVLGVLAKNKNDSSEEECRPGDARFCNAEGVSLREDAQSLGNFSTIAFIGGGALVATGVVLFLTAPEDRAPVALSTQLTPHSAALRLGGQF